MRIVDSVAYSAKKEKKKGKLCTENNFMQPDEIIFCFINSVDIVVLSLETFEMLT